MTGAFTFGIEEEYFLVDVQTKLVAGDVPPEFFEAVKAATDGRTSTEFLQPQVEVISSPHVSMADARPAPIRPPLGDTPSRPRRNATTP